MVPDLLTDLLLPLGVLWLFDTLALLPVLLSGAVRRLFGLWPTDHVVPNFAVGATGFALSHLLAVLFPVALHGGRLQRNVLAWLAGMTLLNAVLWWIAVAVVLPAAGLWQPKSADEYDGRIALTLGVLGYVVGTGLFALVAVVVVIAVGFPG